MKWNKGIEEAYQNKLKNKLFGLLCEMEKNREWEKFLDSILIELYELSSLRYLKYEYFRTTIFDCMNLLSKD